MNIDRLNSFFGEGTVLKGTLRFKGLLRFDGDFEGDIISDDTFIVGDPGKVKATIHTGNLYNFGVILGDVKASSKVSLHANSELRGNIQTPALVAEERAFFVGSCAMPEPPARVLAQSASSPAESQTPKPPPPPALEELTGGTKDWWKGFPAGKAAAGAAAALVALWLVFGGGQPGEQAPQPEAASVSAEEIEALRAQGQEAFGRGDYEQAMEKYSQLINYVDNDLAALKMLGEAALRANNQGRAIQAYEKLASHGQSMETLTALADLYQSAGRKDDLLQTLQKMSVMAPEDEDIKRRMADLSMAQKEREGVIEELEARVKREPENEKLRLELAQRYLEKRGYTKAIETLQGALKSFPRSQDLRLALAQTLHRAGRERDALEHFVVIASANPAHPEARNNLAFSQINKGALKEAEDNFNATLREDPRNYRARLGLALVLSKRNDDDRAAAECQKILDEAPDYAPAMNRLAWILAKQGVNIKQAEDLSRRSLSAFPNIPEYMDTLSEISFRKGDYDEAIRLASKTVELAPDDPYYKRQLFKFQRALEQRAQ